MNSHAQGRKPQAHVWVLVESSIEDDSVSKHWLVPELSDEGLSRLLQVTEIPEGEEVSIDGEGLEVLAMEQHFEIDVTRFSYCLVRQQRIHGRTPEEAQYLQKLIDVGPKSVWVLEEFSVNDHSLSRRWDFADLTDLEAAEILGLQALPPGLLAVSSESTKLLGNRYGLDIDNEQYSYLIGKEQA